MKNCPRRHSRLLSAVAALLAAIVTAVLVLPAAAASAAGVPAAGNRVGAPPAEMILIIEVPQPVSPVQGRCKAAPQPGIVPGGISLYLLVDQELAGWTLFALAEGWQRYQVAAEGRYGEAIPLPEPFGFVIQTADWPR